MSIQAEPKTSCCFAVRIGADLLGSFTAVSGISHEIEMETFQEGGRNTGPLFFPKGPTAQRLTLERGVVYADAYHMWMAAAPDRQLHQALWHHRNVRPKRHAAAHVDLERGLPVRVEGPSFNALSTELAVERIEILHTGILQVV